MSLKIIADMASTSMPRGVSRASLRRRSASSPDLIAALRDAEGAGPLPDERLDAIRVFILRVLDTAGDVGDPALQDFLARGYTAQNALEVVLGIGTYTMSTLANRLTGAPVDAPLAAYAWRPGAA